MLRVLPHPCDVYAARTMERPSNMQILRTPDERFEQLVDYPFAPHYVEIPTPEGPVLRMHYVDEGPRAAAVVLCMHGEPSWSYLYRHMIPSFAKAGKRVIAPDLIGFGRSDKPAAREDYTYARHVAWMRAFVEALDLRDITLFCQDWGGLIGLRLVAAMPERFARVVVANTGLPTGDQRVTDAFHAWRKFSQETAVFPIGGILNGASTRQLSVEEIAAYDAPFPDESYKAGARQFPVLVPISPDDPAAEDNRKAWQVLMQWTKPWLTAFSDMDPVTKGGERVFHERIPGAKGQPHVTMKGGGHFLQEDCSQELAQVVLNFM
jgi:haloalkane dehalogenase